MKTILLADSALFYPEGQILPRFKANCTPRNYFFVYIFPLFWIMYFTFYVPHFFYFIYISLLFSFTFFLFFSFPSMSLAAVILPFPKGGIFRFLPVYFSFPPFFHPFSLFLPERQRRVVPVQYTYCNIYMLFLTKFRQSPSWSSLTRKEKEVVFNAVNATEGIIAMRIYISLVFQCMTCCTLLEGSWKFPS